MLLVHLFSTAKLQFFLELSTFRCKKNKKTTFFNISSTPRLTASLFSWDGTRRFSFFKSHFTDSYRILPILTDFYRIVPFLTVSYRFLPKFTDSGVLLRSMGEEGVAKKRQRRIRKYKAGGKLKIGTIKKVRYYNNVPKAYLRGLSGKYLSDCRRHAIPNFKIELLEPIISLPNRSKRCGAGAAVHGT